MHYFPHLGLTEASKVSQTSYKWMHQGQSVTMRCFHTFEQSNDQTYWYRQTPGDTLKQIVSTAKYSSHEYHNGFTKDRFPAEKKKSLIGYLTVKRLQPEDSGVYFCSVKQHSVTDQQHSSTNTPLWK